MTKRTGCFRARWCAVRRGYAWSRRARHTASSPGRGKVRAGGSGAATTLLDRLGDALRLVSATVPSFFGGARDDEIPCNKCGNGSLAAPRPPPSAENSQMLHNANALDIALYAYAAEHFNAHFDACFPR